MNTRHYDPHDPDAAVLASYVSDCLRKAREYADPLHQRNLTPRGRKAAKVLTLSINRAELACKTIDAETEGAP